MSCCAVQELIENASVLQGLVGKRKRPETGPAPNKKVRNLPAQDAPEDPLALRPPDQIAEPDEEEILVAEAMAMLSAQQTTAEACHAAAAAAAAAGPAEHSEVCKHYFQPRSCMQIDCCDTDGGMMYISLT